MAQKNRRFLERIPHQVALRGRRLQFGPHSFFGLPLIISTFRTFENGTLTCSGGACQGNYGGSFPAAYQRTITP